MAQEQPSEWLDFNEIRQGADVPRVLKELGLFEGLTGHGKEFTGWCPLGTKKHGKRDSFSINTEKKTFQCFACKGRGTILDFVAQIRDIHIREAAVFLRDLANTSGDEPETAAEIPPLEHLKTIREDVEELKKNLNWVLDSVTERCDAMIDVLGQ